MDEHPVPCAIAAAAVVIVFYARQEIIFASSSLRERGELKYC